MGRGAISLLATLAPNPTPAKLSIQLFTDGITNKLMACYTDEDMADAVLVRIYGRKTELFVDRETELRNFQVLHAHGCAPDLYCAFQNGLCYQFLPGIALGPQHVRDPHIFRLVAQEMARVHAIHANGSLPKPILWQKLHKYLTLVKTDLSPKVSNPSLQQDVPSLEVLEQELAWMKETLSQLGSPIVLCHNDLLCKNIIYDRTREQVRFIDYEYTGYNYQAFDIGNHFNEFAGVKEVDYQLFPSKEIQLQWLHFYLLAYKQLTQGDPGSLGVSEEELESLYVQVNKFTLASHFFWACWGLIQDKYSTIDFNFLRYAKLRFKQYFKMKPVVTALQISKYKEIQLQWLHFYLLAYKQLTQGDPGSLGVSEEELESLYVQVNKFTLVSGGGIPLLLGMLGPDPG
ncbi:PREDICTED: ethanolamine kinase 2 [Chaetura pelagica]|uniref:ethanolamine kinase 2 n=1 Tax=Chaetura pelagica TaxID=8897 RepID=UPI00052381ED|nr:PREDICTED: ethanolamine kinase 2 [Chaetura pelagica]